MKRLHVHTTVGDLEESIRFYSTLFGQEPARREPDYAKWMLEDPRVNFAISTWGKEPGIDHLGFQVETEEELAEIGARLTKAGLSTGVEKDATCCYAVSDKHWTIDPAGTPWETFRSMAQVKTRGTSRATANAEAMTPTPAGATSEQKDAAKPAGQTCGAQACCG